MIERIKNQPVLIYLVSGGIILLTVFLIYWYRQPVVSDISQPMAEVASSLNDPRDEQDTVATNERATLFVDLKGEVKKPGVYPITPNMRLFEAIELAGGLTSSADKRAINLALLLTDQKVIYLPKVGEVKTPIEDLIATADGEAQSDGRVNLNQASLQELISLPGIGESKAEAIIRYREEAGAFKRVEDLESVPGFGAKTVERLKDRLII